MRLLIVEDTADLSEAISYRFSKQGHVCDIAETFDEGAGYLAAQTYDLVVLDINLPGGSGFDLLKRLREEKKEVPVLVLTARLKVDDRLRAFDIGADDYLTKPFDMRELEARARLLMRRAPQQTSAVLSFGKLEFDTVSRQTTINKKPCELTRREQILLEIFLLNQGNVLSKQDLHSKMFEDEEDVGINAVELYIARLRRKISGSGLTIKTLRGQGYQAIEPPKKAAKARAK